MRFESGKGKELDFEDCCDFFGIEVRAHLFQAGNAEVKDGLVFIFLWHYGIEKFQHNAGIADSGDIPPDQGEIILQVALAYQME